MSGESALAVHAENTEVEPSPWPSLFHRPDGIHIGYATLGQLKPRLREHFNLLDADERERAARFKHEQDRERFISGHGYLRVILGRYLAKAPEMLAFGRGEFGKPFLEGDPVHFNVSDTKDAVLVAWAGEPLGADVETLHRNTDHQRVADHYFSGAEVESIRNAANGKRRFLELWTRKEAVLKASGVGLMDDLQKLEVGHAENHMMISHPDFVRLASTAYHVRTFYPDADHPASVATSRPVQGIKLFLGFP